MGESLLTLGVGGLVAMGAGLWIGWFDTAYAGIALALVVLLLCMGQFVRRPRAGLLFWSGAALGALLGQAYALWDLADASAFSLSTNGAIGAVLGMLAGGMLADWWQARQAVPAEPAGADEVRYEPRRDVGMRMPIAPRAPLDEQIDQQFVNEFEDYPVLEAEAV